jgi:hypothetical protein
MEKETPEKSAGRRLEMGAFRFDESPLPRPVITPLTHRLTEIVSGGTGLL